ncbi:MAG: hypothetical protein IIB22_01380 [Chloroflexi bacterium]|nr:hypothetical protein [Chloroflexota bacterium]
MALSVTAGAVPCPQGKDPGHVCVPGDASFTLTVDAVQIPAAGYILADAWINYGDELGDQAANGAIKNLNDLLSVFVWPDLELATIVFGQRNESGDSRLDTVLLGGLTGQGTTISPLAPSFYTGTLYQISLTCTTANSTNVIELIQKGTAPAGTSGALYTEFGTNTQFRPAVNNVTINCLGEAEPVESVSTMIDNSVGASLSTGTDDSVEVVLDVPPFVLDEDETITIDVFLAEDVPAVVGDAGGLSRVFRFGPAGLIFSSPVTVVLSFDDSEIAGTDESSIEPIVFNSLTAAWEVATVVARDDGLAEVHIGPHTVTIELDHFSDVIICREDDCDGDGCNNESEAGPDETQGGRRDMRDSWDYYSVLGPGAMFPKDGVIDLPNDILGVILHFSPQGQPPYDANFDRGPQIGANHWERAGPDGVIDLPNDILGVILQFSHNCE